LQTYAYCAVSTCSPDERSDIRDSILRVIPAYRCAHAGYYSLA